MDRTTSTASSGGGNRKAGGRQPNEVGALSAVVLGELRSFPAGIRDMHLGIAERAFRGIGPASRPIEIVHEALTRRAYEGVGSSLGALGRATGALIETQGIGQELSLSTTRGGSAVIAALNGLIGDQLERSRSDLHQPASMRKGGEAVGLDASSL